MEREEKLAKFGDGPWMDEPDHVVFEHAGVPCILHRNELGGWCGYAAVEPGHPWHGEAGYFHGRYDEETGEYVAHKEVAPRVHGGITYGAACAGAICHVAKPGEPDDVWWLGFDCVHSGDVTPLSAKRFGASSLYETYKNVGYARRETESLAAQIVARRSGPLTDEARS